MTDGLKRMGEGAVIYRPTVILKPEMVEMGDHSRIDAFVKVEGGCGVKLGRYVHISSFSHINLGGGALTMEDYSGVSSGVRIATATSKFSAVMPESAKTTTYSFVHFKRWSIAYVGALILPGVTLHEGACAAAGAVIRHDIPPWEIWGGNPARKIGTRTPEGAWRWEEEHEPHV